MTNAAAAQNTTSTEATGERQEWPFRFGGLKRLQLKNGRKGPYGILTIDCGQFEQTAFVFKAETLAAIKAAAQKAHAHDTVAQIWVKGPIEQVARGAVEEDQMKVVYFSDNTKYEGETAEGTDGAEGGEVEGEANAAEGAGETAGTPDAETPVDEQVETTGRDTDDEIPF